MEPLLGLFAASFAAATLFPLPSEAALFAYLQLHPDNAALAVAVATVGNTAGGMTSYLIGRFIPQKKLDSKAVQSVRRYGAPITALAWLPIVGDALSVAAGWLRINWAACSVSWRRAACATSGRAASVINIRDFPRSDERAVMALWEECNLTRPWNDPHKDIARKLAVQPELFLVGVVDEVMASVMAATKAIAAG